jgi:hypothetical protein
VSILVVVVESANLRSQVFDANPGYSNPSAHYMDIAGNVEKIADKQHRFAVAKGHFLADLHIKCKLRYQEADHYANIVLSKARQRVEQSMKDAAALRKNISSASDEDKKEDESGESPLMKWSRKLISEEGETSFYMKIIQNGKRVIEHSARGLKDTAALKMKVRNVFSEIEMEPLEEVVWVQSQDAGENIVEEETLWKQWVDSSKDYSCGPPPKLDHTQSICQDGNTKFSPTCLVTCQKGYDDPDASQNTLKCRKEGKFGEQVYGEWKGIGACVGRMCGLPPKIEKAKNVFQKIRYPHIATYNCYEGYSQNGQAKGPKAFGIPCDETANFNENSSHACKRVECGLAPSVKGVEPISGTFYFSDVVDFKCMPGHTLDASAGGLTNFSVSCQATGMFTQGDSCKPVHCGPPPEYDTAALTSAMEEKYYDDELQYRCNPGHTLDQIPSGMKTFTLRCDSNGEFSLKSGAGPVPQCRPVSAGILPGVKHGNAVPHEMFYGEEVMITADVGYSTDGKPTEGLSFRVSVTPDGTLEGFKKFVPVSCGHPPSVYKANLLSESKGAVKVAVYGDVLDYVCENGYSTDKSNFTASKSFSVQCEADGDYSEIPNLGYCYNIDDCADHTCGPHGACVDQLMNYSCVCESGYEQTWNNETNEFMCGNIDDCGPEACGVGRCEDLVNGFRCICPIGYEEAGEADEKTCRAKICGIPPQVARAATEPVDAAEQKASYKDVVLYQCEFGYTLNGTAIGKNHFSIDCLADTKFTATESCKPIQCGEVWKVEHASAALAMAAFNESIKYTCDDGYTIDGTSRGDTHFSVTCLSTGQYSQSSNCIPVNCGEPDEVSNSHRPDGSIVYKQSVMYECFEGFSLNGKPDGESKYQVKCHEDGSLDPLPSCLPKVCGEPPKRIHSLYATAPDEGKVAYPRMTEVTCRDGFTVDGSPGGNTSFAVTCLSAGKFDMYDKTECQPVRCGPLPAMPNATLVKVRSPHIRELSEVNKMNYEEKSVFKCLPGFSTGGEPSAPKTFVVECLPSGELSAPAPDMQCRNINDCERHTCGPKGTCVDLVGPSPAYTCLCEPGFEIQTNANGEKHCGNTDDCKGIDCGVGSCVDLVGDYTCDCPNGYSIGFQDGIKTCIPVQCLASPLSLEHGKMLSVHDGQVDFPTTLRYECDVGYSVDGSVADSKMHFQAQCKPNGQFDGMMACQKITCGTPLVLPCTKLVKPASAQKSVEYEEAVKYECFDGHAIHGKISLGTEFSIYCKDDGLLTDPEVCEPIKCGHAPPVPKSRPTVLGDVFFGMRLEYHCDAGYTIDGSPGGATHLQRLCQTDGNFSEVTSTQLCKPISGGSAPVVENAVMVEYAGRPVTEFPPSVYYPNGLEYQCKDGYTVNGSPSGSTKISSRVNSLGRLSPELPSACLPITYIIHGQVRDARNGRYLSDVSVKVADSDAGVQAHGGFFELTGIRPGNHTLLYKKEGFIDASKALIVNGDVKVGGLADVSMSPSMKADEWRAVLKWGARPSDLDTYYMDGKPGGTMVYWQRKRRRSMHMKAVLEHDASRGYGPETFYLSGVGKCPASERYCDVRYWVNDYTGRGQMKDISQAQVTLYTGNRVAGSWSIEGCKNTVSDDGNWWHVFTIDGRANKLKWTCKQGA